MVPRNASFLAAILAVDGRSIINIESAGLVRGQLPVAPGRSSLRAADRNPGFRGAATGTGGASKSAVL